MTIRRARTTDAPAIARIFNQGIAERVATFETREQSPERFVGAIEHGDLVLVAERDREVVGAAWVGPYTDRHHYYARVGEATLYVAPEARRSGAGRALMEQLAAAAPSHGYHKLVGKLFTSNEPSLSLLRACGWREVGVHLRHGELDGEWKDVLVVERLLELRPSPGRSSRQMESPDARGRANTGRRRDPSDLIPSRMPAPSPSRRREPEGPRAVEPSP